jgi:hypothetical protein
MADIPLTLNGLAVIEATLQIMWLGAWVADCELDLDTPDVDGLILQTETPVTLILGGVTLIGTIDPRSSGTFAGKATARVVGGRGGWDKSIARQQFHNPAGVIPSQMVYTATGALVGEIVIDSSSTDFGKNYVRLAGPARAVFQNRNWYVEPYTGTTIVGDWPTLPNVTADLLDWSPGDQMARMVSDSLVLPGTVIADERLGAATYTIRDVEQSFTAKGSTVKAWCSDSAASRLLSVMKSLTHALSPVKYHGFYKYRYILPAGPEMALQAVTEGAPDLFIGMFPPPFPAQAPLLVPGTEVIVGFLGGDPTQPFLASPTILQLALQGFCTFGNAPLNIATLSAAAAALLITLGTMGNNGVIPE